MGWVVQDDGCGGGGGGGQPTLGRQERININLLAGQQLPYPENG